MADTKTVSTSKIAMSTLALGIAIGGGGLYLLDPATDELRPVVTAQPEISSNDVLADVTPECWDEIKLVGADPQCNKDGATELRGKWTTDLWQCNGAIMGAREQACLDVGKAKAEKRAKDAKVAVVEEPAEVEKP